MVSILLLTTIHQGYTPAWSQPFMVLPIWGWLPQPSQKRAMLHNSELVTGTGHGDRCELSFGVDPQPSDFPCHVGHLPSSTHPPQLRCLTRLGLTVDLRHGHLETSWASAAAAHCGAREV